MYAHVGDKLVIDGDPPRAGLIIGVPHDDGSPPYVVKWAADGHIAMVSPDRFARVVPAGRDHVPRLAVPSPAPPTAGS
jgi:hypothetical protein